jgi:hypothetical protein
MSQSRKVWADITNNPNANSCAPTPSRKVPVDITNNPEAKEGWSKLFDLTDVQVIEVDDNEPSLTVPQDCVQSRYDPLHMFLDTFTLEYENFTN